MANKYIRFGNKANSVSRIALEKLGLSTKRNDPGTIGQFGSGIKFAPIAAIRNGWEWHFTGKDERGEYHLEYVSAKEDGVDCIFYKYDDVLKPSSFTLEAGSLSWIDPFQIYREAFANALDESKSDEDWDITIVDKVKYEEGYFSCFVTASPELMEVHQNFDKYFSNFRKYLWDMEYSGHKSSIIEKIDNRLRVYSKKILVLKSDDVNSVFDYDITSLKLNEERTIKSSWDLQYEIVRVLGYCEDENLQKIFISKLMSVNAESFYEVRDISKHYYQGMSWQNSWAESFQKLYGDNAVIYNGAGASRGVKEFIQLRGFTPVYVDSDNAYVILKAMRVKDYQSITDESIMYETDFNLDDYPNLQKAIKIAARFEPKLQQVIDSNRIGIYSGENAAIGITINMNRSADERIILIEKDHATEDLINVVATVIHEFDHLSTGQIDGDASGRAFRDLADRRIAELMVKYYDDCPVYLKDGVVHFPMKDWLSRKDFKAFATIEFLQKTGRILLVVNDACFFINGDVEHDESFTAKLSISDSGDSFFLPGVTNVTEIRKVNV